LLDELMPLSQPIRLLGLTLSSLEREPREDGGSAGGDQLSLL